MTVAGDWHGDWKGSGDHYIASGTVDVPSTGEFFYVTDSNGDGLITNTDKDAQNSAIGPTQSDFYSMIKHEIGHSLGFAHSVPEPAALWIAVMGTALVQRRRRS